MCALFQTTPNFALLLSNQGIKILIRGYSREEYLDALIAEQEGEIRRCPSEPHVRPFSDNAEFRPPAQQSGHQDTPLVNSPGCRLADTAGSTPRPRRPLA